MIIIVREIQREYRGTCGTRRMADALQKRGIKCGRFRAGTLMKHAGVEFKYRKKYKFTTDSKHNLPVAPNILKRQFTVNSPDKVWVSDITYLWTREGWLYLAVIIDLYSRMIVGWSLKDRMKKELVCDALKMAHGRRMPDDNMIFHSDRGSQYCSDEFQRLLKRFQMVSSMSRKGNCWDNAVAESFFGSIKKERVYFMDYHTKKEARRDIINYIEMFYNCKRTHSHLGYFSPMEFEERNLVKEAA